MDFLRVLLPKMALALEDAAVRVGGSLPAHGSEHKIHREHESGEGHAGHAGPDGKLSAHRTDFRILESLDAIAPLKGCRRRAWKVCEARRPTGTQSQVIERQDKQKRVITIGGVCTLTSSSL
jgi:hypothetical protein